MTSGSGALALREPNMFAQVALIAARSVRRTLRQPAAIVPPLIFPLILVTINSAGLADAPNIPGFPADSYLDFLLVVTFIQGSIFATTSAGLAMGQDVEGGFMNRLALTPMRGSALIFGQLAGAAVLTLMAGMVYVAYGLLMGVDFKSGAGGIVVLVLLAVCVAVAFSSLGALIALRAGSAEAVQGAFPLLFALMFMSTLNMPLELIEAEWFKAIAQANPVTYMIEGLRSLIITGWDGRALATDLVVTALVLVLGLWGAGRALRTRLTRT